MRTLRRLLEGRYDDLDLTPLIERIDAGFGELLDRGRFQSRIAKAHMPKLAQADVPAATIDLYAHEPAFSARRGNLQQEPFAIGVAAGLGELLDQGWGELSHGAQDTTTDP